MKLSSLINGTKDGVVDKAMNAFVEAAHVAPSLQTAQDNWHKVSRKSQALCDQLNRGDITGNLFDIMLVHAPMPWANQWADHSAYIHIQMCDASGNGVFGDIDQIVEKHHG